MGMWLHHLTLGTLSLSPTICCILDLLFLVLHEGIKGDTCLLSLSSLHMSGFEMEHLFHQIILLSLYFSLLLLEAHCWFVMILSLPLIFVPFLSLYSFIYMVPWYCGGGGGSLFLWRVFSLHLASPAQFPFSSSISVQQVAAIIDSIFFLSYISLSLQEKKKRGISPFYPLFLLVHLISIIMAFIELCIWEAWEEGGLCLLGTCTDSGSCLPAWVLNPAKCCQDHFELQ